MKRNTLIYLLAISFPFISNNLSAQNSEPFVMDPSLHIFTKALQVKNFLIDSTQTYYDKEIEIERLMDRGDCSYQEAKDMYIDLHTKNYCYLFLDSITPKLFNEIMKTPYDSIQLTYMPPLSGRLFLHIGNLDLHTFTITHESFDLAVAMVLKDVQTNSYHYYLTVCPDTPFPFNRIDLPLNRSKKELRLLHKNYKSLQREIEKQDQWYEQMELDLEGITPTSKKEKRKMQRKDRIKNGIY